VVEWEIERGFVNGRLNVLEFDNYIMTLLHDFIFPPIPLSRFPILLIPLFPLTFITALQGDF
jgi:hypothetical protein